MKHTIYLVAGARPNFMKIAPIVRVMQVPGGSPNKITHTGRDRVAMSGVPFKNSGVPEPSAFTAAGGGARQ